MAKELYLEIDKCIKCGSCLLHCPITRFVNFDAFPGPRFTSAELSRVLHEIEFSRDVLYYCTTCTKCMEVCPQNVPTPLAIVLVRSAAFNLAESPEGHRRMISNIETHGRSVEPFTKDQKKAILSKFDLLEIPDRIVETAEIVYFPGCISAERLPEIKEGVKHILAKLGVNYTIPKDWVCCGSPVKKTGAARVTRDLIGSNFSQFKSTGAKFVVSECPGCATHLKEVAEAEEIALPILHFTEYLYENVGIDKLLKMGLKAEEKTKVTLHYPCHIYYATGPYAIDYTREILASIPNVELVEMREPDRCCGAGGAVLSGMPEVAKELRDRKIDDILDVSPNVVVTPCPFCVLNIRRGTEERGLKIPVLDFSTFLATLMIA